MAQLEPHRMQEVSVRYLGREYVVEAEDYAGLMAAVKERTGVELVRLVHKGRQLKENDELPARVLAVGTSAAEAAKVATAGERWTEKRRLRREREPEDDLGYLEESRTETSEDDGTVLGPGLSDTNEIDGRETGFGRLETLNIGESNTRAEKMLRRLARDAGVRDVMRRRGWFVPTLAELAPDGRVGVDPVCVMGLNENKGQRILLRLRTDDLAGFRKLLSVKEVLYHELAHNVRSQHDAVFYGLVSQIKREVEAFHARYTPRRLGGAPVRRVRRAGRPSFASSSSSSRGGHRLGGGGVSAPTPDTPRPRPPLPSDFRPRPDTEAASPTRASATTDRVGVFGDDDRNTAARSAAHNPSSPEIHATPPRVSKRPDADVPPGLDPASREARIVAASRDLATLARENRLEAAATLQIIINNATQPEDKYKRIRLNNKRFQRTAGRFAAALRFLEACGFQRETEPGEEVLVLRRQDPGLLWCGRSALESIVVAAAA